MEQEVSTKKEYLWQEVGQKQGYVWEEELSHNGEVAGSSTSRFTGVGERGTGPGLSF